MKSFWAKQKSFVIIAVILGFILHGTNCIQDEYCDPDPIYGGCSSSCDYELNYELVFKIVGLWVLMRFGSSLGEENLKNKDELKQFLNRENLQRTVRVIDEEWKKEDQEYKNYTNKLLSNMKKLRKT